MPIQSMNPATEEVLERFEPLDEEGVEFRLQRAAEAFRSHRGTSFMARARMLRRVAASLDAEQDRLGRLMSEEMGKPLAAARAEAAKCAWVCRHYVENAERLLEDEEVFDEDGRARICYHPLGPVLAVMPWNFPFWQVFRFAAPALMAGNVCLLKHASNVPRCALAIEALFARAGFPAGAFQTLLIPASLVERVISDPRVAAVTLTGSEAAGIDVAAVAARQIKKCVLELGGSDPFLVMPSADLDAAVKAGVNARILNNGQSCIAAKRFIVAEACYDAFVSRFVDAMAALKVGDPLEEGTAVGPLAMASIREEVHGQVERLRAGGAKVLTGGSIPEGRGFFYPPTVVAEIPEGLPVAREEIFGPVAMVFKVKDLEEAIHLANASDFGLGAAAFTRDEAEIERLVRELEAGSVFINGMVASDPRLPFGGIKRSGLGRELGVYGLREFVNIKTVWVR